MITLILDNLRSTYNVGAILRTADAVGVDYIVATGTTPYPAILNDTRPLHVITSNTRSIAKVALGAETTLAIRYVADTLEAIQELKTSGTNIIALEQSGRSVDLFSYAHASQEHIAVVLGPEVTGITPEVLSACDVVLEIPMFGHKESLNVSVAAGVLLYQLRLGRDSSSHQ